MRVTSYLSGGPIPGSDQYSLLHGIRGSLEIVASDIGEWMLRNRGEPVDFTDSLITGDQDIERLRAAGFFTVRTAAEERLAVVALSRSLRAISLSKAPTSFMLVPSLTCNLRCPYCFQSHEMHKGKGRFGTLLSEEQIDIAFDLIDRLSAPGSLSRFLAGEALPPVGGARNVGLFGGEPLTQVTRPVVLAILHRARQRGIAISAVTNGVELDQFLDLVGPDGLAELQITLDGARERHDRRRVGPGLSQTFDRISDNISHALERGAAVSLRINVDSDNLEHLAELDTHFHNRGWYAYSAFNPYAAAIDGLSPQGNRKRVAHEDVYERTEALRDASTDEAGSRTIRSYEDRAEELVRKSLLEPDVYPFEKGENCSAETGQLIFDPLGNVYSCWEDVGDDTLRIGAYDASGLRLDDAVVSAWLHRFPGAIAQCSECPFALVHVSGCAAHARVESGSIAASACEGFPDYFPRALGKAVARFARDFRRIEATQQAHVE